ncbi:MAG: hydrogenase maturation protease [Candidatus Eisenbacteria bacterium]|nr:hydrogenase maturation protease [Candidatus Eisenbacteria bacterium]
MRTLILGLGSQGFEGRRVGLEVARGLYTMLADPDVDIVEAYDAQMDLFDIAAGYYKVVVVDCIRSGEGDVGELRKLGLSGLDLIPRSGGPTDTEYRATVHLEGAKSIGIPLEISIYAIELGESPGFTIESDAAAEAVPRLVAQIAREEFGTRAIGGDWY